MTNKKETQETTRTTINLRNTEIVNNEIYIISGAQDGNSWSHSEDEAARRALGGD